MIREAQKRKGTSPLLATVIRLGITLIAAVAIVGFVFGLVGGANQSTASVTPAIYSPDYNVGVLNEVANFSISITNAASTTQNGSVVIQAAGDIYQNETFTAPPGSSTLEAAQVLRTTGPWEVDCYLGHRLIGSYSFDVEANTDQAQLRIDQNGVNRQTLYVAYGSLVVASLSALLAAFAFFRRPREGDSRLIENIIDILHGIIEFLMNSILAIIVGAIIIILVVIMFSAALAAFILLLALIALVIKFRK